MIAFVTDSTACITEQQAKSLGVYIVPETYSINRHVFHESYADKNGNYEWLIIKYPHGCRTAHSSIGAFMSIFSEYLRKGFHVFCLTISSRLSGTYSSAVVAARELNSPDIMVVDSLTTAGGLHLLLEEARRLSRLDGMTLDMLAAEVEKLREKIGIVFSVDNIDNIRASGRLGMVRQSLISSVLNMKPILLCRDGTIISDDQVRGRNAQVRILAEKIPQSAKKIILHYFGGSSKLGLLKEEVKSRFPNTPLLCCRLGPVLGIHLGFGTIGAAWITE
jgi:DegV family protein with EDD domain